MLKASVIFLSYNQEKYVEAALRSALDQNYDNIEILIGDDASTDETRAVIEQVLATHPRSAVARLLPPQKNLGLIGNWERVVKECTGDFLIAQAGDDISLPTRTASVAKIFSNRPTVMAVIGQVAIIDEQGQIVREKFDQSRDAFSLHFRSSKANGFNFWCGSPVLGASASYRRTLADCFGPISRACSEDEPYVYRALLVGEVAYSPEVNLLWRWHGRNLSVGSLLDETYPEDVLKKRAAGALMRKKACDQHVIDLDHALLRGFITKKEFDAERRKIETVRAIQGVAYCSIDNSTNFGRWLRYAYSLVSINFFLPTAWAYLLRSLIKRFAPRSIKLRYSRPAR